MISHEHKCIFVHIPRTGGTSIEATIWPRGRNENTLWMGFIDDWNNKYQTGGLQHLLAKQIREEVGGETFSSYWKFSFVRNPWDKIISQYHYIQNKERLLSFLGVEKIESLEEYLALIQKAKYIHWEEQWKFLYADSGECLVDTIYRFEDFRDSAQKIYQDLKLQPTVLHVNQTDHEHYSKYYTPETRELVAEMYAIDIDTFNYEFENV